MKIRARMTETCTVVVEFEVSDTDLGEGEELDANTIETLIVTRGFGDGKTVHFETEDYSLEAWIKIDEFTTKGKMLTEAEIECEDKQGEE